jgi:hypothetical protein
MLEKMLIAHCAPTLAGIKTGNLFNCCFASTEDLRLEIEKANEKLNRKGIHLEILRKRNAGALILAYRPVRLRRDLQAKGAADFLSSFGYLKADPDRAIERLKERFAERGGFPHEIGLFLSYPLADVIGFIENEGQNSKCAGCWKAYRDEAEAMRLFDRYRKCGDVYRRMFAEGRSVLQLTVAA